MAVLLQQFMDILHCFDAYVQRDEVWAVQRH